MKVAIIGSGISGLSCASKLRSHAITPYLFDKGKRPGGRLSTLKLDNQQWDFGCPYIVPTVPAFAAQTQIWQQSGWLAQWSEGPDGALVGVPTMAALVAQQCADHHVQFQAEIRHIVAVPQGWTLSGPNLLEGPFDAVALALPSEQAAPLLSLHDLGMAREAASARSGPCWSLMVGFTEPFGNAPPLYQGHGTIARAIRTNSKPQRHGAETWVIEASPSWSQQHIEDNRDHIAVQLLAEFQALHSAPLPPHSFLKAHRWRFAHSYGPCGEALWNAQLRLGACGDWCIGSGVEGAWLSGQNLGEKIRAALRGLA